MSTFYIGVNDGQRKVCKDERPIQALTPKATGHEAMEHLVRWGSVNLSDGEWLYYFCQSCGEAETTIYANRYTDEEWAQAVDKFDREHPHTEDYEVPCC